jgi:polysaccharide deacetylase 2 family uncharacterized protein YibQ
VPAARLLLPLLVFWSALASGGQPPALGIIIDDIGYDLLRGRQALALPGAMTYAFIPGTPNTPTLAREAYARGKEIMVHLPMEADNGAPLEAGGLVRRMSHEDLRVATAAGLAAVPNAVGVNNHMGSLLTRDEPAMAAVMTALASGPYYFVDSRTTERSVAERVARRQGVAASRRDVFLDNERSEAYIEAQFAELVRTALERGNAIAIAHPYPETLAVLRRQLPRLAEHGVGLLPVSRIIERQRRLPTWHAFSSPSPKVAKNSKP